MLTDQDVLLLKLALERELIGSQGYRQVLENVRRAPQTGSVGRALRQVGVAGEKVTALAERAAGAAQDPRGTILVRCDLEDALVARALEKARLVDPQRLERARNELRGLARTGELTSLSEVLVKRRWLEVPMAVALRRRARARVATCGACFQHYVVSPERVGRYRCRGCRAPLEPGSGCHSAIEVARGTLAEKPPPPIEQSQLLAFPPETQQVLKEARERGLRAEAERLAARGVPVETPPRTPPPRETPPRETQRETPPARETPKEPPAKDPGKGTIEIEPTSWESVHDLAEKEPVVPAAVASFGEYEILTEVARGGMGIIYKARRKGAQKILALKILMSGVDATEEQVQRFEREGESARKLRHPNIVRVYDAGRHEGYHYIAMEFVEGDTLETRLAKGPFEPRRSARIIRDLARAVQSIHQAGIIHRDLKPGNIILDEADAPKLIDFGLAKTIDRRAKLTRSGVAVGTPFYMPPEQVKGEKDKVGPPSDVYALGAILYEMIVGEVPFKAENPVELYHKIASSELVLPEKGLPPDLVTIVAKAMQKQPRARYATADELAQDLDRFLAGETVQARRASPVTSVVKRARRRGAPLIPLLALAALAVAIAAGLALHARSQEEEHVVRTFQERGRGFLAAGKLVEARQTFEDALLLAPHDPSLEVDLARALAAGDRQGALVNLEHADLDGLRDPALLTSPELAPLAEDPRFRAVCDHVRLRR